MFHPWLASSWRNLQVFGMLIYVYINKEPLLLNNIYQNFHEHYQPEIQNLPFNITYMKLLGKSFLIKLGTKLWKEEVTKRTLNIGTIILIA